MERLKSKVTEWVKSYEKRKESLVNDLKTMEFEHFLQVNAKEFLQYERTYNNVYYPLQQALEDEETTYEDVEKYLEEMVKTYHDLRIEREPIIFSTNPIVNLIRLWSFENYTNSLKQVKGLLNTLTYDKKTNTK